MTIVCGALFCYWGSQTSNSYAAPASKLIAESTLMQTPAAAAETERSRPTRAANHPAASAKAIVFGDPEFDTPIQQTRIPANREDRLQAIASFGHHDHPQASLELQSLLDDSSIAIREEAVEALAALNDAAGITGLAYAMSDDDALIRRMAIELLAENGSDAAIAALMLALDDQDPRLRRLAVDELAAIGGEPAALVLQQFVADADVITRERASGYLRRSSRP